MIKEERRQERKRKKIGKIILVIVIVFALLALIVWKVFTVKNVEVSGNELYSDTQIQNSVLNDKYSWNTLYVFFKYKFKDTQVIPFVDSMEISMKIPHTIKIEVYEKGLLGYVTLESQKNQYAYFDKDGLVVEVSKRKIEDVPNVTGLSVEKVTANETLPVNNSLLKDLLNLTQTLKKYSITPTKIKCKDNGRFVLKIGKIKVNFGDADNLENKVLRLNEILPQLDGYKGTLHMENYSEQTTDIVFEKSE
ncbi:cell division protein FtsQ/DivIB [Eubacterium oxidoreducens]|uniref:Cell division protein FtsQ n=1 Tax=Eubacterium oxidoreducens TaxID=1732 RepID=A0A1G6AFR5_EUBOX|nr:cell division protein FtsQ/DivIB [Eubacterium oxidoreducens]SDB07261.1 cell division protein FtsQ [Eubacterium oxidoreducens]